MQDRWRKRLHKKAKRGARGYPIATVAYYGYDGERACKVVVSNIAYEGAEPDPMLDLGDEATDVRLVPEINRQILDFIEENGALSVALTDGLLGCPHQTGIDYDGDWCPDPRCTYWFERDRFTKQKVP